MVTDELVSSHPSAQALLRASEPEDAQYQDELHTSYGLRYVLPGYAAANCFWRGDPMVMVGGRAACGPRSRLGGRTTPRYETQKSARKNQLLHRLEHVLRGASEMRRRISEIAHGTHEHDDQPLAFDFLISRSKVRALAHPP
jgi:hypothetical protein